MNKYTIYWRMPEKTVVEGDDFADAMNNAGYGQGAVSAIDFYASGENDDYEWNATTREWDLKIPLTL
ncbi:MAG: hypothetical protein WC679_00125 [Bacteroidales bacterium]